MDQKMKSTMGDRLIDKLECIIYQSGSKEKGADHRQKRVNKRKATTAGNLFRSRIKS